jgi:ABC-type phosphate/phosphonate transport system substrate-binding protein
LALFFIIAAFGVSGMLDLEFQDDIGKIPPAPEKKAEKTYYIGVVSRFAPSLLYKGYQPIVDYLNRVTPYRFALKMSNSYEDAVEQLSRGETVAAFLGTYVFAAKMRNDSLFALLAPRNDEGKPVFRVMLVTREDSKIDEVGELAGKKVGMPSRMSFSGNWLQMSLDKELLKKIRFIHYDFHHTVIQHIFREDIAAGVVKDRVAEEYIGKGIRVIKKSEQIPASPLVAGPLSDKEVLEKITEALTGEVAEEEADLNKWDPEFKNGFIRVKNKQYAALRKKIAASAGEPSTEKGMRIKLAGK